jgi:hypothetical protein
MPGRVQDRFGAGSILADATAVHPVPPGKQRGVDAAKQAAQARAMWWRTVGAVNRLGLAIDTHRSILLWYACAARQRWVSTTPPRRGNMLRARLLHTSSALRAGAPGCSVGVDRTVIRG